MGERLPLFPLGTVLFPGLVLPLHVFEDRYRALVQYLTGLPDGTPRAFGVVAIQRGWEVAQTESPDGLVRQERAELTLHEVGCTAEIRQVVEHSDGRFDLVTVGRKRFRIVGIEPDAEPYLVADVEYLPDHLGSPEAADRLAPRVLAAFRRHLALVRSSGEPVTEQLPQDPAVLSHLVAATAVITLDDRQHLLAQQDTVARLRAELVLLNREEALLRRVRAVPVPLKDLAVPLSPN